MTMFETRRAAASRLVAALPWAVATTLLGCGPEVRSSVPENGGAVDAGGRGDAGGSPKDAGPLGACSANDTCALLPKSCCGTCGAPTPTDMTSVRWDQVNEYRSSACAGTVGCPACWHAPNPHFTAVCRGGQCQPVDVRADELAACEVDADCVLRLGTGCCEPCQAEVSDLTALARKTLGDAIHCPRSGSICPECVVEYPSGARAVCNAKTKHCEVSTTRD